MKKIICCVPLSWDYVPKLFFISWFAMQKYCIGKYDLELLTGLGCYSDTMRDKLVDEARLHKPNYIVWIDADQTYSEDTLEVLANHVDDGKLVVGGLTPMRLSGFPNVHKFVHEDGLTVRDKKVNSNQGVVKVDAMGLGGIMMSPKVFKILEPPYFRTTWKWSIAGRPGMDFQFYSNCKKAGVDVWCDTDLVYGHVTVDSIGIKNG